MTVATLVPQRHMSSKAKYKAEQSQQRAIGSIGKRARTPRLSTLERIGLAFAVAVVAVPWWMGVCDILRFTFGH